VLSFADTGFKHIAIMAASRLRAFGDERRNGKPYLVELVESVVLIEIEQ
jgi:hypothetical protein